MTASRPEIRLLTRCEAAIYREVRLQGLKQNPEAFSSTFERESAMPLSWFEERIVKEERLRRLRRRRMARRGPLLAA